VAASDITRRKQAEGRSTGARRRFPNWWSAPVRHLRRGFPVPHRADERRLANRSVPERAARDRRDFAEAMRILWPEPVAAEIIAVFRHTSKPASRITRRPSLTRATILQPLILRVGAASDDAAGRQYGVICYYFDSTKLREAEAAVRESEERLRMVIENSLDGINMLDLKTGVTSCSALPRWR